MADLALTQRAEPGPAILGAPLTYTLTIRNDGPSDVAAVRVVDELPAGVRLDAAPAACIGGRPVTCTLGPLAAGAVTTLTITATPTAPPMLVNRATVTADALDPNPANNTASVQSLVLVPDGPDLVGSWADLVQTCKTKRGARECSVKGHVTIRNTGNRDAAKSQLAFYLSADPLFDGGDLPLKDVTLKALKVAKSASKSLTATVPGAGTASGGYVLAVVDGTRVVSEANEFDNTVPFGPVP